MRALELFCASGGLAAGFRNAGVRFDLAFDRDPDACASYEANLGERPVQVDARDLLRMARAGWRPGPLDLIAVDPPCAPWSRAGKRKGQDDERDMLSVSVELISILRPQAYLIGNIPGLEDKPNLGVVRETIGGLRRHGYCVADFATLDAADFGVPQIRKRPFWYGHRSGPCIVWPARTHCAPRELRRMVLPGFEPLKPWVSCAEAFRGLPAGEIGRPVRLKPNKKHPASQGDAPSHTIGAKLRQNGASVLALEHSGDVRPKRDPSTRGPQSARVGDPQSPAPTIDARPARVGAGASAVLSWPWDRPATTVMADERLAPPGTHPPKGTMSMPDAVVLSEVAAKILMGLPSDWVLAGKTKNGRWQQLAQAVPIVVAEALGRSVLAALSAGVLDRLVHTSFEHGGLTDEKAAEALAMLGCGR